MLPTTGYFKNIDCPYYEDSCDRPYCHFKHRKKTQECTESPKLSTEIPTYNPTPKSQLANVRSHIPITYVPDLATRSKRTFRSSSFGYNDKQPIYNPTPLSILSTGKTSNNNNNDEIVNKDDHSTSDTKMPSLNSTLFQETDIDFESLETEFDLIDELMHDSGTIATNEDQRKEDKQLENVKYSNKQENSKSNSSSNKSSRNGTVLDKNKRKSESRSKSRSHSSKKLKESHQDKKIDKRQSHKSKKHKSKDKHKEKSSSKEKEKHKVKSKDCSSKKGNHIKSAKHETKESKTVTKILNNSSDNGLLKAIDVSKGRKNKSKHNESKIAEGKETEKFVSNDMHNGSIDFSNIEDSDVDFEDEMEECYKIFTEYKPTEPQIFSEPLKTENSSIKEMYITNKKRIAHDNVERTKSKTLHTLKSAAPTPAQVMVNRYKLMQAAKKKHEQEDIIAEINRQILKRPATIATPNEAPKVLRKTVQTKHTSATIIDDILSGKPTTTTKIRRIAPVQNVNSIQRAKAKIEEMTKANALLNKTTVQTITKGTKRVAHTTEFALADIPIVLEAERSKLPVNVRTRYLTMITEECVKLYINKDEAYQRALNEEYKCYERCSALVTYRNSTMLAINRLRKELQEREMSGLGPILSDEMVVPKKKESELQGHKLYENIKRFILNEEELVLHGFPRQGSIAGHAIIKIQKQVCNTNLDEYDRLCSRCSKIYQVDDDGFAVYEEECLYHPLKKRTFRGESIYLCCKTSEGAGCVTAPTHVCEKININQTEIEGFQMTLPPENDSDSRSTEVFALDCEMCYTTKGLELTRVTIVNSECKTVYETLVKPFNPIIDYNTRFSGITEEQMNRTATSILQVQANILHLCNSKTILIGHSLESDMKALKIIHSSIIDTSVLFPHKFGLPHKRALRDLAREYLKKIIQNEVGGHDSAEDALTCMELVQWKVKEELKGRGIKV